MGVANYLARRQPRIGSSEFGKSFEHYILGEKGLALEIKGSARVHEGDLD